MLKPSIITLPLIIKGVMAVGRSAIRMYSWLSYSVSRAVGVQYVVLGTSNSGTPPITSCKVVCKWAPGRRSWQARIGCLSGSVDVWRVQLHE